MKKYTTFSAWVLVLTLLAVSAHAESPGMNNADLFDGILKRFAMVASTWASKMVDFGTWLFWGLTLISMVWTYGMMALKKADIGEFFAETIRFLTTTGFFLWILINGPAIAISIIDSMRYIASEASGAGYALSPSGIMDIGFDICFKVIDNSSVWSPASSIVGLLVAIVILLVLTRVAINLLLVLISAWLVAYGGVFLLGFGGGRWTQDIAINYYKNVLGIGVQTMAMILIVGVGKSFIDPFYAAIGIDLSIKDLVVMLVVSIILLSLINKLPPMLAGIVSGGGGGGGGGGLSMGAALAAGGMAGAAASSLATAAVGAGANIAGGVSALKAAFQAAQAGMSESGGGSGGKESAGGGSGGSLASAMGGVGRMAMSMGQHLASGAGEIAKEKIGSMKEAVQDKIASTVGGQIAEAITNNSAESNDETSGYSSQSTSNEGFDGGSLSAGSESHEQSEAGSQNEEVAQFVNKSSPHSQGGE